MIKIRVGLHQWFIQFLIKTLLLIKTAINSENQQLSDVLRKPVNRKLKKCKVYSSFKDNIWSVDLRHMQLISKY